MFGRYSSSYDFELFYYISFGIDRFLASTFPSYEFDDIYAVVSIA